MPLSTTPPAPIAHSLFDAKALRRFVEKRFEIGKVEDCQLWRSFLNDVFRIRADGKSWWLRIHPVDWRTPHQVNAEVDAVMNMRIQGASVSAPIQDGHGDCVINLDAPEGMRMAVLFSHAEGKELEYFGADGERNARRYGVAVAKLHDACDTVPNHPHYSPIDLDSMVLKPRAIVARHLDVESTRDLDRICTCLIDRIHDAGSIEPLFCHGDLNGSNVHFDGDNASVFDFDCCGWGSRAFELAAFARGVAWLGTALREAMQKS